MQYWLIEGIVHFRSTNVVYFGNICCMADKFIADEAQPEIDDGEVVRECELIRKRNEVSEKDTTSTGYTYGTI